MLNEVADGVWVRQSEWVWSNAIVVRGEGGLVLVDPGIDGSDLNQLADDVDRLGSPVVAGFSTHPHWDHLLWHPGSATCRATPPPPAPRLPVKPESGRRGWRRRAHRASLSS
jgi:glyoxylase-like metal-dependent hydrolase (beta-lactamase superfamily II)